MGTSCVGEQLDLEAGKSTPKKKRGRPPKQDAGKSDPSKRDAISVALDLGNATTQVAYRNELGQIDVVPDPDGLRSTRSVIAFENGDPDRILWGRTAQNYRRVHPEFCCEMMKRARGHGDVPAILDKNGRSWNVGEVESLLVKLRLKHIEETTGKSVVGVLVCVPADFNDAQRRASVEVVKKAGYMPIGTVNEPTAAVVMYGKDKTGTVAVVDIGGGTTDVSIVEVTDNNSFSICATAGRDDLGGREFTAAILDHCLDFARKNGVPLDPEQDARDIVLLETECENAKHDLTTQESVDITFRARDRLLDLTLTRATFEKLVAPLCKDIQFLLTEAMTRASLQPQNVNHVVLAGGSSRVLCARAGIQMFFGPDKIRYDINADEIVVGGGVNLIGVKLQEQVSKGNTYLQSVLPEYQFKSTIELKEVLGQALGVLALDKRTEKDVLAPIVEQGVGLPFEATRTFGIVGGNEPGVSIEVVVLQGNDFDHPESANELARFSLSNLPAGPTEDRVKTTFSVDTDGLVEVHAVDTFSGKEIKGRTEVAADRVQQSVN